MASSSSSRQNLLKGVIADRALPLGSTVQGSIWSTKALHPADLDMPTGGIPDLKAGSTAVVSYNNRYAITAPPAIAATDTWDCEVLLTPTPECFGCFHTDITGAYTGSLLSTGYLTSGLDTWLLNPQLPGTGATPEASAQMKLMVWQENVRQHRPTFFGATVTADAPTLTQQGMVLAAQYPAQNRKYNFTSNVDGDPVSPHCRAMRPMRIVPADDWPTFDSLQNMPNVFSGKAREGVYLPLKLTQGDLEWQASTDLYTVHTNYDQSAGAFADSHLALFADTGLTNCRFPARDMWWDGVANFRSDLMPKPSFENVGHLIFRGLSPTTKLYLQVRAGFEITVQPGSIFTPYLTAPTEYDPVAMTGYFAIAKNLADAYPESYNSAGTILTAIAAVASSVLPVLIPVVVDGLKSLASRVRVKEVSEDSTVKKVLGAAIQRRRQAKEATNKAKVMADYKSFWAQRQKGKEAASLQQAAAQIAAASGLKIERPVRK